MAEVTRLYPTDRPEHYARGQLLEPLWREVLGSRLRTLRKERWETLAQTAERAGISPQYLSEIERGRKEPSSEMIAALVGALGTSLADLMTSVAEELLRLHPARVTQHQRISEPTRLPQSALPSEPTQLAEHPELARSPELTRSTGVTQPAEGAQPAGVAQPTALARLTRLPQPTRLAKPLRTTHTMPGPVALARAA